MTRWRYSALATHPDGTCRGIAGGFYVWPESCPLRPAELALAARLRKPWLWNGVGIEATEDGTGRRFQGTIETDEHGEIRIK